MNQSERHLDGIPTVCYIDSMSVDLEKRIRTAMKLDGRTVYAFARDAGLRVSLVQKFAKGGGLTLRSASRLCSLLGLDLMPVVGRKGR